jgi:hypothetical protein
MIKTIKDFNTLSVKTYENQDTDIQNSKKLVLLNTFKEKVNNLIETNHKNESIINKYFSC